jgi:hypothetical protein
VTEIRPDEVQGDGHRPDRQGVAFSLTDAESAALRRARLAKAAAQHLPLSDITAEIRRMSEDDVGLLARRVRTRSKAPAPAIAQALRSYLARANEDQSAQALNEGLHNGVISTGCTAGLADDELAALLSADRNNIGFLVGQPLREALTAPEEFGGTAAVRTAVWSSMVSRAHEGGVAALAWLIADPPSTWNGRQSAAVAAAWTAVREQYPMLPQRPASIQQLCSTVNEMELSGSLEELAVRPVAGAREEPDAGADPDDTTDIADRDRRAPDDADLIGQLTDLSGRIDAEQAAYAQVRDIDLPAIVAAMDDGLVPPLAEVARLGDLGARLTVLLAEIAAFTGGSMPRTAADAAEQVEEMAEALTTDSAFDRIRRLAGLVAPEYVAVEADAIRNLAASVGTRTDPAMVSALDALVTAILLGSSDPERSAELSRVVQPTLPAATVLVMLAGGGHVSLDGTDSGAGTASEGAGGGDTGELSEPPGSEIVAEVIGDGDLTATDATVQDEPAGETAPATAAAEANLDDVLAGLNFALPDPVPLPAVDVPGLAAGVDDVTSADLGADINDESGAHDEEIDTSALYVRLVRSRQFALAGWLAEALQIHPAVSAVHRLVAYASAMRGSAGPNAAAFADEVKNLDAGTLASLVGGQMMVYAASVRVGLLSPTAGAAVPLRDLTHSITKAGSAVEELTEALLAAFYGGVHLTARSANAVAEAAGLEAQHTALASTARDLLDTAASRSIRYQAATELWRLWMGPNGYLGIALAIVAAGSRSEPDLLFVRRRVTELRSRDTIEKVISDDSPKVTSARPSKRLEPRARDKIIDWAGDVAGVLADWVANVDDLDRISAGGGWTAAQVTELRVRVSAVRSDALSELKALATSDNVARNAAVEAGIALLAETLDLLSGEATVNAGAETLADRVATGPLILAVDLPFQTTPVLRPSRPVVIADVVSAADTFADGPAGWTAAFSRRSEKDDHVGTYVLLEFLRGTDQGLARRLSAARERDVADAVAALDAEIAALSACIDSDRLFGRLTYDQWSDLSIRARAYEAETRGRRWDFDVMRTALADIETDRAALSLTAVEAAWERMGARELTDEQITRVSVCIEAGDLTTADEYLETIRVKGDLPADRNDVDHLKQFFPAFPALFSAAGRNGVLLNDLKRAIDNGRNPADGKLGHALESARIDVSAIVRDRAASGRIDHWLKLTAARTLDKHESSVKPVLEHLGYIVAGSHVPPNKAGRSPGGRSAWMYLSGVRATSGKALIPEFGTRMSPSGDTLRLLAVWGAPTVPEIVEQLRSEPVQHSVIVLYFGTLSVAARNEFADALRGGRKLPPTIVIDDPMFAYLAAQPAPRRDITMSVALPFASAEPFTPDVAGLVPVEMFYGRAEELDQVVNMMGSCIVYGGRQLGKSALLRAAAREFANGVNRHAIYQSIYTVGQAIPVDAVWPTLWPRLAECGIVPENMPAADVASAVARHITSWIAADSERQLLMLLDESDFFLDADAKDGSFTHVMRFKDLMEATGRSVKVVFAGLHQTARFERLSNHPLAHLGNPVCVGPLTPQYAYDLLTRPLQR